MIVTDFREYQELARRTQNTALPLWAMREHALFGLSSEVGEVMGIHQKVHQGHPLDETALRLEIGDIMWFISELCDVYGWSMEDIAIANIQKLRVRYKDKFSAEQSIARVDTLQKGPVRKEQKRDPVRSKYYSSLKKVNGDA